MGIVMKMSLSGPSVPSVPYDTKRLPGERGGYSTGRYTKSALQMARLKRLELQRALLAHLQAHEGEKFFLTDLAIRFGLPEQVALNAVRTNAETLMFRAEALGPRFLGRSWRVWYGSSVHDDPRSLAARITRAMRKAPIKQTKAGGSHVVTAITLAKSLGEPVQAVAQELEAMHARGELVRCELLLRQGYDRFEYRILGSVP